MINVCGSSPRQMRFCASTFSPLSSWYWFSPSSLAPSMSSLNPWAMVECPLTSSSMVMNSSSRSETLRTPFHS